MAQKKKTTSTVHASPSAAAAHFAQEAKAALSAGQADGGTNAPAVDASAWKERIEADTAAVAAHDNALRTDPDTIMQAVKHCLGRWPEDVLIPLEHSYKVLQWMEVLSSCIADTLASESADSAIPKAKTLADIAKWIASETAGGYLDAEIEDMKDSIEAARAGGAA